MAKVLWGAAVAMALYGCMTEAHHQAAVVVSADQEAMIEMPDGRVIQLPARFPKTFERREGSVVISSPIGVQRRPTGDVELYVDTKRANIVDATGMPLRIVDVSVIQRSGESDDAVTLIIGR